MKIKLIERGASPEQNREIPITQPEFLIGRGADCDLKLPVSSISRHHCLIRVTGDEAAVIDLGSSNGTFLNGQRVRSQAVLCHDDELHMGACRFRIVLGNQDQPDPNAAPGADPYNTTVKLPAEILERKKQREKGANPPENSPNPP